MFLRSPRIAARPILERNHVVCLVILFSCQRADFRRKGGQSARPLRPCQAKCLRAIHRANPSRLTRTLLELRRFQRVLKRSAPQEPEILVSAPPRCQPCIRNGVNLPPLTCYSNSRRSFVIRVFEKIFSRVDHQQRTEHPFYSSGLVHNLLCRLGLPLGFRDQNPRLEPPTTPLPIPTIPRMRRRRAATTSPIAATIATPAATR